MPESLIWSVSRSATGCQVRLTGKMSEDTDFTSLLEQVDGPLAIDLGEVRGINSCGVREWVRFVTALDQRRQPLSLERCPPCFVRNMCEISNFVGSAEVQSIYLPYFCPRCESTRLRLAPVNAQLVAVAAESQPCSCGGAMTFDDVPELYFAFLP